MYKSISFYAAFNERTGYGLHATNMCNALEKLIPVYRNQPGGEVSISLLDSVSIQNVNERLPYPSFVMNAWESTLQPDWFIEKLKFFDGLFVVSEWQKACSVAQGIKEEFVYVIPEGVNPDIYKPIEGNPIQPDTFNFVHIGQWQPRKSTKEIVQSFLKAFPRNKNVRLYLSADTLFPSDSYKSTEERLQAYGLNDPRIIPVHFEERDAYIRRLQSAHCFVSCSRAEGWGLPMCEAMAVGIPTIVADWSGSTEYAGDALNVRISELKKPEGIYGNWDVPGKWGEPDYDHLVEVMKDAYKNYAKHKEKALKTSEMIRTKFSWAAVAKKAYDVLEELSHVPLAVQGTAGPLLESGSRIISPEQSIRIFARKQGFEITAMQPRKAIFTVDCWPSSQAKMDTLTETIKQIHDLGYQVLVSSHYALPAPITELCDFYLYEKQDIMSGDDKAVYWRTKLDGVTEHKQCNREYQGVAVLNNFRNAIDFCRGKYDWIYQMSSDMEVDLEQWLSLVHASDKPMVCIPYEGVKNGIGGGILAGKVEFLDKVFPYLSSWKQYVDMFPDVRFVVERWQYNYVATKCDIKTSIDWISIETSNRFDNVDREIWKDDQFQCHFVEGPYLNIVGISNREYDVVYSNPIDGENYYNLKQKPGMWSRPNKKYFRDWTVKASLNGEVKYEHKFDLTGRNVLISMGSKALGDTIAWMPYIEEFRKKNNCHVVCAGWWQTIFDYPEIQFVTPGETIKDIYASYEVGCFDTQLDKNVTDWRLTPLQKVASDILGLDYEPIRAKLKYEPHKAGNGKKPKPYICFSEFSTMQNKFWNREGAWQKIINYLNSLGYDCISVSVEPSQLTGIINHNGQSIEQTMTDISGAAFYIGLNAGPTWLAYALNIPAIMITGVSEPWNDFPNPYRVAIDVCRPGCFNDPFLPIDRGWDWCPRKKDYACTRDITESMVIKQIDKIRRILKCQSPSQKKAVNTKSVRRMQSTQKEPLLRKRSPKSVSLTQ
jgi:autotransporter strand-loop-strand O-heptosyltransferase